MHASVIKKIENKYKLSGRKNEYFVFFPRFFHTFTVVEATVNGMSYLLDLYFGGVFLPKCCHTFNKSTYKVDIVLFDRYFGGVFYSGSYTHFF